MTMYQPVLLPPMKLFSIIRDPVNFMWELAECKWARASLQFIRLSQERSVPDKSYSPNLLYCQTHVNTNHRQASKTRDTNKRRYPNLG